MGRPRTPLLDRERIGATALELIDEQGEFSVPRWPGGWGCRRVRCTTMWTAGPG